MLLLNASTVAKSSKNVVYIRSIATDLPCAGTKINVMSTKA